VADDVYYILERLEKNEINKTILAEEFIISPVTGKIKKDTPLPNVVKKSDQLLALEKLAQAQKFNLPWRLTIDREWFFSTKANDYFEKLNNYLEKYLENNNKINGSIGQSGGIIKEDDSLLIQFAHIMLLLWDKREQKTHNYYDKYILTQYDYINNVWRGKNKYLNNTWGWFIMAGYNKKFPNIWQSNIF
jgi:hypothetical protein